MEEYKPIIVSLVINLAIVYLIPKLFINPTGVKAFDDFVSYLKAQQAFIGFSSVLLAIVLLGTQYYLEKSSEGGHGRGGDLLTEDFMTPAPSSVEKH
jgi:hypothetical protein